MKYNKLRYLVFAGMGIFSCFSYSFSIQSVIPDRLKAGGVGPFTVTGGPPNSVTLDHNNFTGITLCTNADCSSCLCDPTIQNGMLILTVGQTYSFSSAALIAISNHCGGAVTQSVRVLWGSPNVSNLCMNIQCGAGNCSYGGAPGSVTLS